MLRRAIKSVGRKTYRTAWHLSNVFSRQNLRDFVKREVEELNSSCPAGRVLNVGAGGEVARWLGALEPSVTSIDVDPERGPDVVADVCDMGFLDGDSLDAVFMIEVLEHVKSPARALEEVRRVLKPGGLLLLSTPFLLEIHDAPHDFYRFTRHGLEHLLRDFGRVEVTARNGYFSASLVPLIRLTQSHRFPDFVLGAGVLGGALLSWPLVRSLDAVIQSSSATTGYVARCVK